MEKQEVLPVSRNLHFGRGPLSRAMFGSPRSWWKPGIWKVVAANQPETLLLFLPGVCSVVPELAETRCPMWARMGMECPAML